MKLELKENMYIRTKGGYIDKILKLNESYVKGVSQKDDFYAYDIDNIVKASYSIIDILEVGDYVNGSPICLFKTDEKDRIWIYTDSNYKYGYLENEIKSIVTKEQFEQMAYKVGE